LNKISDPLKIPDGGDDATLARAVRYADRIVDAIAALLLLAGVSLFAVGRQALTAIADGSYAAPEGTTWVARADLHTAQTQWGMGLIAAGVAVAVVAALRHLRHRQRGGAPLRR